MRKTVISLFMASGCFYSAQLMAAGEGCLDEQRTLLSQAIGVLVYDNIVRDYKGFVDVEHIAAGILHASDRDKYALSSNSRIVADPESGNSATAFTQLSGSAARSVVKNWRSQSDQLGERFLTEYGHFGQVHKSGLMTHRHDLEDAEMALFNQCADKYYKQDVPTDSKQVCFVQLSIDESSVCEPEARARETLADMASSNRALSFGVFNVDELIEGWVQAFEVFENDLENSMKAAKAEDSVPSEKPALSVYEVVVPAELGYGSKGMPNKVDPDETLWFLMAVL